MRESSYCSEDLTGTTVCNIMCHARIIGTGEMVELIARETKAMDVVDEGLTLKGLKMIYEMNSAMGQ